MVWTYLKISLFQLSRLWNLLLTTRIKINRDTDARSQGSLNHLSYLSFLVTFVVTRNLFNFTHSVTQHLQAKLNDTVLVFDLVVFSLMLFSMLKSI